MLVMVIRVVSLSDLSRNGLPITGDDTSGISIRTMDTSTTIRRFPVSLEELDMLLGNQEVLFTFRHRSTLTLINMSFESKTAFCEPCKLVLFTTVKAEQFCYDCRERYCGKCALDHSKFRVLLNHQLFSLDSQTSCDESEYLKPVNTRNMKGECFYDEYVQKFHDRDDQPVKTTHTVKGFSYVENVQKFHDRGDEQDKTRHMKECFDEDDQQDDGYVQECHDRDEKTYINTVGTEAEHVNPDYESGDLNRKDAQSKDYDYVDVNRRIQIAGTRSSDKQGTTKVHTVHERTQVTKTSGPTSLEARLDLKERREIERTPSVTPRFDVKVLDTHLARRIKGISIDDVLRYVFKLTLEKSCFSLSFGPKKVLKCDYQIVRRYGMKDDAISIEVGRKCELGPGFLMITTAKPKELFDMLRLF